MIELDDRRSDADNVNLDSAGQLIYRLHVRPFHRQRRALLFATEIGADRRRAAG